MRLDISVLSPKQLLRPVNRQLLGNVDKFTSAVPPSPRIAFRVLVGQNRTLRLHDSTACKVFRSDQLDILKLAFPFVLDHLKDRGIDLLQTEVAWLIHAQ